MHSPLRTHASAENLHGATKRAFHAPPVRLASSARISSSNSELAANNTFTFCLPITALHFSTCLYFGDRAALEPPRAQLYNLLQANPVDVEVKKNIMHDEQCAGWLTPNLSCHTFIFTRPLTQSRSVLRHRCSLAPATLPSVRVWGVRRVGSGSRRLRCWAGRQRPQSPRAAGNRDGNIASICLPAVEAKPSQKAFCENDYCRSRVN